MQHEAQGGPGSSEWERHEREYMVERVWVSPPPPPRKVCVEGTNPPVFCGMVNRVKEIESR